MAPSLIAPHGADSHDCPSPKRQRTDYDSRNKPCRRAVKDSANVTTISRHSLGVKPLGNAFTSASNLRDTSTGLFALLPDELILQLLGYLDARSLLALGTTSRGLYAFSRFEELWKDLFIDSYASRPIFTWQGTWRSTYLNQPPSSLPPIDCPSLFSDALYRPFYCSQINLHKYTSHIPSTHLIPRLPDLSVSEFNSSWADKPFILTDPVKSWLGYTNWAIKNLVSKYGDVMFRAEAVDWTLENYHQYMTNNTDESPLYLFDKWFEEKTNMGKEYTVPLIFKEDFFSVLGDARPDRKWMILGPERSGSSFHKDPNATSAWNAVVQGEKYWIMFPNDVTPPGVFVSEDMSEVTSPLSIAEWFEGFHSEARRVKGVKEGICGRGEVLHVPSGWWHLVVNLSPSLAITQNFVPRKHLSSVLSFLRDQPQSISGFDCEKIKDPYALFVKRMMEEYPEILEQGMQELESMCNGNGKKRGKWDELVNGAHNGGETFAFNFLIDDGSDSDEEEEEEGEDYIE